MHESAGIQARTVRKVRVTTTDSNHRHPIAENIVDRNFSPSRKNETWVADITYIPMRKGFLYLVAIVDLFSRNVLSWKLS